MLALVDDWGNPAPGSKGTDWFGFASILVPDNNVAQMRDFHCEIRATLGQSPSKPIQHNSLGLKNKYHIMFRLAKNQPVISLLAIRVHAVTSANLSQRGWAYRFYGREMVRVATHFALEYGDHAAPRPWRT